MRFWETCMQFIERAKQYPLVLWALALYLCSLGFNLKYDIPLIILLVTTIWAINRSGREQSAREFLLEHWHVISFVGLSIAITFLSEKPRYSVMAQAQFIPALLIYCAIVSAVDDIQKQRFVYIAVMVAGLIAGIFFVSEIFLIEHPDMMTRVKLSDNPLFIVPNDVLFLIAVSPLAWGVIF